MEEELDDVLNKKEIETTAFMKWKKKKENEG